MLNEDYVKFAYKQGMKKIIFTIVTPVGNVNEDAWSKTINLSNWVYRTIN